MKILVTGGKGMVGKHLQEILPNAVYIGSEDYDLRDWLEVENLFLGKFPQIGNKIGMPPLMLLDV